MTDAQWTLDHGNEFPFHGKPAADKYEKAVLGILADLTDRRGVKHELRGCDDDIKEEIVESLAAILRVALP